MAVPKPITVNGIKYDSINKACESLNLPLSTICKRLETMSVDAAFAYTRSKKKKRVFIEYPIIVDGKEFYSLKDACKHFKVSQQTFVNKRDTKSLEDIFLGEIKCHNNKRFRTIKTMCEYYGVSYTNYMAFKKNNNMSDVDALKFILKQDEVLYDSPKSKHSEAGRKYSFEEGVIFTNFRSMCQYYHTTTDNYRKMKEKGFSNDDIFLGKYKDHLGNRYRTLQKMCDVYGIRMGAYKNRISLGWDIAKALTTPLTRIQKKHDLNEVFYNVSAKMVFKLFSFKEKQRYYWCESTKGMTPFEFIFNEYLWKSNSDYCGMDANGSVILRDGTTFKKQPFKEYIEDRGH